MINNKNTILILIMFIFLIIIPVNFAENIDNSTDTLYQEINTVEEDSLAINEITDNIKTVDNNNTEIQSTSEITVNPGDNLKSKIQSAGYGSTIYVNEGTYEVTDTISISSSKTVIGVGNVIIDGLGKTSHFYTSGSSTEFTLKNVTLINGKDSPAGSIKVATGSSLNIENCNFINNTVTHSNVENYPGIISTGVATTVSNCVFINNTNLVSTENKYPSIIHCYNTAAFTITNCIFADNSFKSTERMIYRNTQIGKPTITANDNYWGSNSSPDTTIKGGSAVTADSYLNFDISTDNLTCKAGIDMIFNTKFTGSSDNHEIIFSSVPVTVKDDTGTYTINSVNSKITYTPENVGSKTVKFSLGEFEKTFTVNVIENDGLKKSNLKLDEINVNKNSVTITSSVADGASGNIIFYVNDENKTFQINGNTATAIFSLESGHYNLLAVYNGDSNYLNSSAKSSFDVVSDYIYVSGEGSDENGTGGETHPFKSIEKALELNRQWGTGKEVIVNEGKYTVNNCQIQDSVTITGKGKVILTADNVNQLYLSGNKNFALNNLIFINGVGTTAGSIQMSASSKKVNINNCSFINNRGKYIIYAYGDVIITKSNFINNNAENTVIYSYSGSLDTSYSNFINNSGKVISGDGDDYKYNSQITADNNYWGSNDGPSTSQIETYYLSIDKYVDLTTEMDNTIEQAKTYDINIAFKGHDYDLTDNMADLEINITSNIGEINKENIIINNKADLTYSSFISGDEKITFTNNGNTLSTIEFSIEKTLETPDLILIADNITYGDGLIITATTANNITGNITFNINNENYTINIVNGSSTKVIEGLLPGDYEITAIYNGNKNYSIVKTSKTITVNKLTSELVIGNVEANVNASIMLTANSTAKQGTVTFKIDDNIIGTANVINNQASINYTITQNPGTYSIKGTYADDGGIYLDNESSSTLNVLKENETVITLKSQDIEGLINETVILKVTTNAENGTITFKIENTTLTSEISNNQAAVNYTITQAPGKYDIIITYNNNTNITQVLTVISNEYNDIIYVSKDGDDDNQGSIKRPVLTIAKAIELATNSNNTAHKIVINEGTYTEYNLFISSQLEIVGNNAVIDALKKTRIFSIDTADEVKISGITFINGRDTNGGAIEIRRAPTTIDNCTFINNTAAEGGAVYWNANNGILSNSIFTQNRARVGAAVSWGGMDESDYLYGGDNGLIINTVFDNNDNANSYGQSMGLSIYSNNVTVKNSNFTNNNGKYGSTGGSLHIYGEYITVDSCLFENNTMDQAPAIECDGNYARIINSIFINNTISSTESARAGAVEIDSDNAEIINNTFIENGGDNCYNGGAIALIYDGYKGYEIINISNNIFISNTAAFGAALFIDGGYEDYSIFDTIIVDNNIFDSNEASTAAGIYVRNVDVEESIVNITNNEFKNLNANHAAAIYIDYAGVKLANNTITDCISSDENNHIFNDEGYITGYLLVTVNNNDTHELKAGKSIYVNATVQDDMGNAISGGIVRFIVEGNDIDENGFSLESGIASVNFYSTVVGRYLVSADYIYGDLGDVKTSVILALPYDIIIEFNGTEKFVGENKSIPIFVGVNGELIDGENITVTFNNETFNITVYNGLALVNITLPDENGTYSLSATYDIKTESNDIIAKDNSVKLTSSDVKVTPNTGNLIVNLKDIEDNPLSGEKITIILNGKENILTSDENGNVNLKLDLGIGTYTAVINYAGGIYKSASINSTVSVVYREAVLSASDINMIYNDGSTYIVRLTDSNSNPLANEKLTITFNNETLDYVTDENGLVTLLITVKPGNYDIIAKYNGNSVFGSADAKNTINITSLAKLTGSSVKMYYKDGTYYKVRLYGDDGQPVGAGEIVKLTINKKTYSMKTDKNGYASVKISLKPKTYTVTATYGDLKVSNKVVVKKVLSAKSISKKKAKKIKFSAKLSYGKKPLAKKKITFKFKGKTYKAKTNKKGVATITLKNVKVGKHTIRCYYGASMVKKTIKIKK